jgi:hypothetical protein
MRTLHQQTAQKRSTHQRREPTVGSRNWTGDRGEIASAAVRLSEFDASARPLIVALLCHGTVIFIGKFLVT